jgi:hypothetical protein
MLLSEKLTRNGGDDSRLLLLVGARAIVLDRGGQTHTTLTLFKNYTTWIESIIARVRVFARLWKFKLFEVGKVHKNGLDKQLDEW